MLYDVAPEEELQLTVTWALPAEALTPVGADGVVVVEDPPPLEEPPPPPPPLQETREKAKMKNKKRFQVRTIDQSLTVERFLL